MLLRDLIKVLDGDSKILISESGTDLFDGVAMELHSGGDEQGLKPESFEKAVKSLWYSTIYNRIMIDI